MMEGRAVITTYPDKIDKPVINSDPHDTTAIITWKNHNCLKYYVRWWIDGEELHEVQCSVPTYTFTDLRPGCSYNLRVAACIMDGVEMCGEYSEALTFCTAPKPPHNLRVLPGRRSPDKSFIATFEYQESPGVKFEVFWRSLTTGKVEKVEAEYGFASIEGLTPGDEYDIWTVAVNGKIKSKACRLEKRMLTYPATVTSIENEKSSPTSQTIHWKPVFGADSYLVKWKRCDDNYNTIPTSETELTLSQLRSGHTYKFCVASVNSAGQSEYSKPMTFKTDVPPPHDIKCNVLYNGDDAVLEVGFAALEHEIDKYVVTAESDCGKTQLKETWTCHTVISGLIEGSCYTVSVQAIAIDGIPSRKIYADPVWILPPQVSGIRSEAVTENSEKIMWDNVRGAESYSIYVDENGNKKKYKTRESNITVTNLILNRKYAVTVTAVNQAGQGRSSEPISFMTALSPPQDIQISNISEHPESGITVTWKGCDGAVKYDIQLIEASTSNLIKKDTTQNTHYEFRNLECGREYRCTVKCISDKEIKNSTAVYSKSIWTYFTQVEGLISTIISPTTIKLKWKAMPSATAYKLMYRDVIDGGSFECDVNGNEHTISNLPLGKQYVANVSARNAAGEGEQSEPVAFRTGMIPPSKIEVCNFKQNPSTVITVTFTEPEIKPSYYAVLAAAVSSKHKSEVQRTEVNSLTISDLLPGQQYIVQIWSVFEDDERLNSKIVSSQKIWTCPQKVSDVKAIRDSKNAQDITWTKAVGSTTYNVKYKRDGSPPVTKFTDTNSIYLNNLNLNCNYDVTVTAGNSGGFGEESKTVSFQTALHPPKQIRVENSKNNPTKELVVRIKESLESSMQNYKLRFINLDDGSDEFITTSKSIVRKKDLQPGIRYKVGVCSVHETDEELNSEEIFSDPISTIIPALEIKTEKINFNEQKVIWNEVIGVSEYRMHWRIEHENDWKKEEVYREEYVLRNLEPGKKYEVYVVPFHEGMAGEKSNIETFITVPAVPTGIQHKILSTQELKLSCDPCVGANGYIFNISGEEYKTAYPEYILKCNEKINIEVTASSYNDAGRSIESDVLKFRQVLIFLQRKFNRIASNLLDVDEFVPPILTEIQSGDMAENIEFFASQIQEGETILIKGENFTGKTACCSYFFQSLSSKKFAMFLNYEDIRGVTSKITVKSLLQKYMPEISCEEMNFVFNWMNENSEQVILIVDNFNVSAEFKPHKILSSDEAQPNQVFYNLLVCNRQIFPKSQVFCSTSQRFTQQILGSKALRIDGFNISNVNDMRKVRLGDIECAIDHYDVLQYFCANPGFCRSIIYWQKNRREGIDFSSYSSVMVQLLSENIERYPPQEQKHLLNRLVEKINDVPEIIRVTKIDPEKIKSRNRKDSKTQAPTSVKQSSIVSGGISFMNEGNSTTNGREICKCENIENFLTIALYFALFAGEDEFKKIFGKKSLRFGVYAHIWIMVVGLLREETMKSARKLFELANVNVDEVHIQKKFKFVKSFISDNIEKILKQIYSKPEITLEWFLCCNELNDETIIKKCSTKIIITEDMTPDEIENVAEFISKLPARFVSNVRVKYNCEDPTKTLTIDEAIRRNPNGENMLIKSDGNKSKVSSLIHGNSKYQSFGQRKRTEPQNGIMSPRSIVNNAISEENLEEYHQQIGSETTLKVKVPQILTENSLVKITAESLANGVGHSIYTNTADGIIENISPGEAYLVRAYDQSGNEESLVSESVFQTYKSIDFTGGKLEVGSCVITFPEYKLEENIQAGIALCKNQSQDDHSYVNITPVFDLFCSIKTLPKPVTCEVRSYCSSTKVNTEVFVFRFHKEKWIVEYKTVFKDDRKIEFPCSELGPIRLAVKPHAELKIHLCSTLFYDSIHHNLIHIMCFDDNFDRERMKHDTKFMKYTPFRFRHISVTDHSTLYFVLSEQNGTDMKTIGEDSISCKGRISELTIGQTIFPIDISKLDDESTTALKFEIFDNDMNLATENFNFKFGRSK